MTKMRPGSPLRDDCAENMNSGRNDILVFILILREQHPILFGCVDF